MPDGNMPGQLAQRSLVENLGDQAHLGVNFENITVGGGDSGAFLSAVL